PRHAPAVEDQLAAADLDRVSGQADHPLDEVGVLARVAEHDDVAARRETAENAPAERREAKRKAVARISVRPFGDHEVVADVERWQHGARGNAERRDEETPQRPGEDDQGEDEAGEAPRILSGRLFGSVGGRLIASAAESWPRHLAPLVSGQARKVKPGWL